MMSSSLLFMEIVVGLSIGGTLFLVSSGFTIIWGVLGIPNFAHVTFYALGAYSAYSLAVALNYNFWVAFVISPLVVAAAGLLVELLLLRRVYAREHVCQLLLTFGVVYAAMELTTMAYGPIGLTVAKPFVLSKSVPAFFGTRVPIYYLFVIGCAALVGLGLWFLLQKTRWGALIRASAFDRSMAGAMGVNVPRLFTLVFTFGAWLAGLGGVLMAPMTALLPDMGILVILEVLAAMIIGGLGSLPGSAIGSLILGLWIAIGTVILPNFSMVLTFILAAIVLTIRPRGILGR